MASGRPLGLGPYVSGCALSKPEERLGSAATYDRDAASGQNQRAEEAEPRIAAHGVGALVIPATSQCYFGTF